MLFVFVFSRDFFSCGSLPFRWPLFDVLGVDVDRIYPVAIPGFHRAPQRVHLAHTVRSSISRPSK